MHIPFIIRKFLFILGINVRFAQTQYTGSEAMGFVMVTLELVRGTSANPFNVTVTPSEQPLVSAEGNSVMCMIVLSEECLTNRWC